MELSSSEDRMRDRSLSHFYIIPGCDRRTDGQAESIIANTALCIASCADAL